MENLPFSSSQSLSSLQTHALHKVESLINLRLNLFNSETFADHILLAVVGFSVFFRRNVEGLGSSCVGTLFFAPVWCGQLCFAVNVKHREHHTSCWNWKIPKGQRKDAFSNKSSTSDEKEFVFWLQPTFHVQRTVLFFDRKFDYGN